LGTNQPPVQWIPWVVSGGQRPEREANCSLVSNAEVKSAWSCTFTPPYVFMAWWLFKPRGSLTLTVVVTITVVLFKYCDSFCFPFHVLDTHWQQFTCCHSVNTVRVADLRLQTEAVLSYSCQLLISCVSCFWQKKLIKLLAHDGGKDCVIKPNIKLDRIWREVSSMESDAVHVAGCCVRAAVCWLRGVRAEVALAYSHKSEPWQIAAAFRLLSTLCVFPGVLARRFGPVWTSQVVPTSREMGGQVFLRVC
jgi:hypothetical protein